jgi:surface protein
MNLLSFLAPVFANARVFNSDISKWDTSKVTSIVSSKLEYIYLRMPSREHAIVVGGFRRGFELAMMSCKASMRVRVAGIC